MNEENKGHLGTKFLALFIGIVLSVIYTLLQFFTHDTLTTHELYPIAMVWAFFTIVIPLIVFMAEILFRYAHKYSEKFPMELTIPIKFWKLKILGNFTYR
jgi:hypothetical protein